MGANAAEKPELVHEVSDNLHQVGIIGGQQEAKQEAVAKQ